MDKAEAKRLVEKNVPSKFRQGRPTVEPLGTPADIVDVTARAIASLWARMGNIYKLTVKTAAGKTVAFIHRRKRGWMDMPSVCRTVGATRGAASILSLSGQGARWRNRGCAANFLFERS